MCSNLELWLLLDTEPVRALDVLIIDQTPGCEKQLILQIIPPGFKILRGVLF